VHAAEHHRLIFVDSLADLVSAMDTELTQAIRVVPQLRALPKFPEVRRDLSLVVSEVTRYEQIAGVIRQAKPEFLEDFEYVTTYRGKPLEKGQKSVTLTLAFRSPQMTLTSEQVEGSVQRVIASAKEKLGATLRA